MRSRASELGLMKKGITEWATEVFKLADADGSDELSVIETFCILPDLERKLLCHQEEFSGSEPEYDSDYDDLDTAGQLSSFMNMFNKKSGGKKKSSSKIYSGNAYRWSSSIYR